MLGQASSSGTSAGPRRAGPEGPPRKPRSIILGAMRKVLTGHAKQIRSNRQLTERKHWLMPPTVAADFDKVIHAYSTGRQPVATRLQRFERRPEQVVPPAGCTQQALPAPPLLTPGGQRENPQAAADVKAADGPDLDVKGSTLDHEYEDGRTMMVSIGCRYGRRTPVSWPG
jgi:hypothetical protein